MMYGNTDTFVGTEEVLCRYRRRGAYLLTLSLSSSAIIPKKHLLSTVCDDALEQTNDKGTNTSCVSLILCRQVAENKEVLEVIDV